MIGRGVGAPSDLIRVGTYAVVALKERQINNLGALLFALRPSGARHAFGIVGGALVVCSDMGAHACGKQVGRSIGWSGVRAQSGLQ